MERQQGRCEEGEGGWEGGEEMRTAKETTSYTRDSAR